MAQATIKKHHRDPAGREKARVFNCRVDAQRFLTEVENSKLRGTWTDPALGRVLFREWLAEWWSTTTNLRPSTRARDEMLLCRYALPRFGNLPLAAIRQREVRAWVADLAATELAPPSQDLPPPGQGAGGRGGRRHDRPVAMPASTAAQA